MDFSVFLVAEVAWKLRFFNKYAEFETVNLGNRAETFLETVEKYWGQGDSGK